MKITVIAGKGFGQTTLSAFDAALQDVGVCNYNLIPLSSVIPPASEIVIDKKYATPVKEYGFRLYVVKAEIRSDKEGDILVAGVGWYQLEDGRGLFVEHELIGEKETQAKQDIEVLIKKSLQDLCKFREIEFIEDKVGMVTSMVRVEDLPACALVLAVYKSESWK